MIGSLNSRYLWHFIQTSEWFKVFKKFKYKLFWISQNAFWLSNHKPGSLPFVSVYQQSFMFIMSVEIVWSWKVDCYTVCTTFLWSFFLCLEHKNRAGKKHWCRHAEHGRSALWARLCDKAAHWCYFDFVWQVQLRDFVLCPFDRLNARLYHLMK